MIKYFAFDKTKSKIKVGSFFGQDYRYKIKIYLVNQSFIEEKENTKSCH